MPYVTRDESGQITAIFDRARDGAAEQLAPDHPEIAAFLGRDQAKESALAESDAAMSRVLEDVIELLIDKGVILITDLPQAALDKITFRRALRGKFSEYEHLLSADKDKII